MFSPKPELFFTWKICTFSKYLPEFII